jgi:hypothetical protein
MSRLGTYIIIQYQCVMYHLTFYILFYFHIYLAMHLVDVIVALDIGYFEKMINFIYF